MSIVIHALSLFVGNTPEEVIIPSRHHKEIKQEIKNTILKKEYPDAGGGEQFKQEFSKLLSTMKDLEIKVYQESIKNRELKNIVIKQEQSVKDYKYLVEKIKQTMTKQKVTLIKDKDNLMDEIVHMKSTMDIMKDTLHKQDYFLKTLEKNTHDLQQKMNPGPSTPDGETVKFSGNVKVIPVQSTSQVTCDGLSKNATKYRGKCIYIYINLRHLYSRYLRDICYNVPGLKISKDWLFNQPC